MLVVIAIIAILIGLLLPAVQKVREAAERAQQFPQLQGVASFLLENSGVENSGVVNAVNADLQRAASIFSLSHEGLPRISEVEEVQQALTRDETNLRRALTMLPNLGPADDADYRAAYLDLRKSLVAGITELHRVNAHLSQLLNLIRHFDERSSLHSVLPNLPSSNMILLAKSCDPQLAQRNILLNFDLIEESAHVSAPTARPSRT